MLRRPPRPTRTFTLLPNTTRFRSEGDDAPRDGYAVALQQPRRLIFVNVHRSLSCSLTGYWHTVYQSVSRGNAHALDRRSGGIGRGTLSHPLAPNLYALSAEQETGGRGPPDAGTHDANRESQDARGSALDRKSTRLNSSH